MFRMRSREKLREDASELRELHVDAECRAAKEQGRADGLAVEVDQLKADAEDIEAVKAEARKLVEKAARHAVERAAALDQRSRELDRRLAAVGVLEAYEFVEGARDGSENV